MKKGMSLIHPSLNPRATWEFDAEIVILHHATTLVNGYSPMMHIGVVTQAVRITEMRTLTGELLDALRTGDRAIVHCRCVHGAVLSRGVAWRRVIALVAVVVCGFVADCMARVWDCR